ncbi:cytochrome c oxidase subunit CcoM [Modicisalibacter xianhensis]|nr:cytochrome c oxidase subunit CcoM [Halomonas xianhensis]
MYWDEAVVFGLVTVGLLVAFMGGLLAFVVHDNKRSKGKRPQ